MKSALGMTMRISMMGLATRPGTEVLPTCSIERMGMPSSARSLASSSLIASNWAGHSASYALIVISMFGACWRLDNPGFEGFEGFLSLVVYPSAACCPAGSSVYS